jgi:hypothetical protein
MRVKIEEKVQEKVLVDVEVRPALYAQRCDGCGVAFHMKEFCNDQNLGQLRGTFDGVAIDAHGKSMGNTFLADVCSFACAQTVLVGGWRKIKDYKPFAKQGYDLARAELRITTMVVRGEEKLREAWSKIDRRKANARLVAERID